jgi:hypothetical protein
MSHACRLVLFLAIVPAAALGCASPYYADKGAAFGGLAGAGTGALIGNAVGSTGAGALIGAGVGALSGAAIGSGMDDIEARNRAEIAAQLGRQLPPGTVTLPDVIAMTKAGVNEELIANHVRANGLAHPLQTGDLIALQNSGVSTRVIAALQEPRAAPAGQAVMAGPPVVMPAPYYYPPPYYYAPPPYYNVGFGYGWGCRPRPRVGWGVSVGGPL